jgi:hypothetical protein
VLSGARHKNIAAPLSLVKSPLMRLESVIHPPFAYTQSGRNALPLFLTAFFALLAAICVITDEPLLWVIAAFLLCLALSGLYSIIKGETWTVRIDGDSFIWSYARWPKSSGTIDLKTVRHLIIRDHGSTLTFIFDEGRIHDMKLMAAHPYQLRDYLAENFSRLSVEYIA